MPEGGGKYLEIGVLDIFGFEDFKVILDCGLILSQNNNNSLTHF